MSKSNTTHTEQHILNESFDTEFSVLVHEPVRRNAAGTALEFFNPATEEKQDRFADYIKWNKATDSTYKYKIKSKPPGYWVIYRKEITTGEVKIAHGDSDPSTAWTDRATQTYLPYHQAF